MKSSNYGIIEIFQNIIYIVRSKIIYPQIRMIRFPIVLRGKRYIDFGKALTTGRYCRIEVHGKHPDKRLILGENVNIGDNVSIRCANKIIIGNNVLMGSKVLIIDNSHGKYSDKGQDSPDVAPNQRSLMTSPILIGNNVWIGEGAVIQQGVTIGNGSIIAANSIVTKDVPANCMIAGIPAKIIKKYDKKLKEWIRV